MEIQKLYQVFRKCGMVSTDSRNLPDGCLFVALKGEKFDGNAYALDALGKGAGYALVSDKGLPDDDRLICVDDTLKTLQDLAQHHRRQFDIPVVAITGSNGKTTTKELVSAVLSTTFKTHFTKGNFNNHIGVPLTLLAMSDDTEIAVIEMGANHLGEIDFLCRIAEPNYGMITNVGKAHLEGFGSFEGVRQTKSEMYRYLHESNGTVFVNQDESFLEDLIPDVTKTIPYRQGENGRFHLMPVGNSPFVQVELSQYDKLLKISTQLIGSYNFNNILTAVTVGAHFNVRLSAIKTALENYVPSNNRSQFIQKDANQYVLDAYNANPTSMRIAIENFATLPSDLKKIVILGDMLELGEESKIEHTAIIELAQTYDFSRIILVGDVFGEVTREKVLHFADVIKLKSWFDEQNFQKHFFLIKGSRGIRLEKLLLS